jgi:hypothetical protein
VKFHKNPFSGSRVAPSGHVDGRIDRETGRQAGRQADMTNLLVGFRNFSNAPKNSQKPVMNAVYHSCWNALSSTFFKILSAVSWCQNSQKPVMNAVYHSCWNALSSTFFKILSAVSWCRIVRIIYADDRVTR